MNRKILMTKISEFFIFRVRFPLSSLRFFACEGVVSIILKIDKKLDQVIDIIETIFHRISDYYFAGISHLV
jgi:hypothetical protein